MIISLVTKFRLLVCHHHSFAGCRGFVDVPWHFPIWEGAFHGYYLPNFPFFLTFWLVLLLPIFVPCPMLWTIFHRVFAGFQPFRASFVIFVSFFLLVSGGHFQSILVIFEHLFCFIFWGSTLRDDFFPVILAPLSAYPTDWFPFCDALLAACFP